MGEGSSKPLWVLVVLLLIAIGLVQQIADPIQLKLVPPEKHEGRGELMAQLPGQFIVASLAGFKEVIAGALWVRADTFFHEGKYEAIIPIVRLVTWLDPHNIDVYTTGAWHLDYNFVDSNQMSDKRYIPSAIALLEEGIRKNPGIWDLYFELGWTHYNKKVLDYEKALECIEKACKLPGRDPNTGKKVPRPDYTDRMLAHQYEKVGRFDDAIRQWGVARRRAEEAIARERSKGYGDETTLDVCDRNLALLYLRLAYRYGNMEAYRKGVELMERLARRNAPPELVEAAKATRADYERRKAANDPPRDALKPLDAGFEVTWKKIAPKVFILKGKINLVPVSEYKDLASEVLTHFYRDNQKLPPDQRKLWRDGCRVRWMICDYDYKMPQLKTFSYKIDKTKTVAWDSAYVSGGTFSDRIDLSQDPEFYPFKADKYRVVITFVPQQSDAPDYVQDRIGWKGEALRDKRYLDLRTQPGFRLLRKEFVLTRKDVM
ncbi:MAG: tetratricopeptide repeat protein [Armatimonadetes bacterium]|nr:tetratricopeptide repeat protein [Armatimonadota bacterium]